MDQITTIRRRSSLFTVAQTSDTVSTSIEHKKYEKQLRLEVKQWTELLRMKCESMHQMQSRLCNIDQSVLTEEQRKYLADGPKVDDFVSETEAFDDAITTYIQRKSFLLERKAHIVQEAKALVQLELMDSISTTLSDNLS